MQHEYEPELGQMVFGQPSQRYDAPESLMSALSLIGENLVAAEEARGGRMDNPFSNTGEFFRNAVFEARAYSWREDEEQPFNFAWRDMRVSWYKYLGRGTSVNMKVDVHLVNEMLAECIGSIWSGREPAAVSG